MMILLSWVVGAGIPLRIYRLVGGAWMFIGGLVLQVGIDDGIYCFTGSPPFK
jgi:hypothetical protein